MIKNFFWSKANTKMIKTSKMWEEEFGQKAKFVSFNIPRLRSESGQTTCPYAGMCAEICYAGQGHMAMPAARSARERNLAHINRLTMPKMRDKILEDLQKMQDVTHIRIHDSGDFFNKPYYHAWIEIAESCPDKIFYAYTKSIPFLDWSLHSENFRIVQSLGGMRDHDVDRKRPHSKIFANEKDRDRAGYCDGNISDIPAVLGKIKIGLVYHGNQKLTEEHLVKLRVA